MTTSIWWIRRDIRLCDNQALAAALGAGDAVVPVFILDPVLLNSNYVGPKRINFLYASLRSLDIALQKIGSRLIVQQGNPALQLSQLVHQTGAAGVFAEEDYTPYARRRDKLVAEKVPLYFAGFPTVFPAGSVMKNDGKPYTIFTPFSKAWKAMPFPGSIVQAPRHINSPGTVHSMDLPNPGAHYIDYFPASEEAALERLENFTSGQHAKLYRYGEDRNLLAEPGTAHLSPYLRFGQISARHAALAATRAIENAPDHQARKNAETWLDQLIWREFYTNITFHFPSVHKEPFRPQMRNLHWANRQDDFDAWCTGHTGYPVVDAGMRQLCETGWMHNRARMIAASFLTKDLLVDWRWGEKWFMQHLIDGDPAQNNGGWQWTAGTGTDAAPYFRIFNPVIQGKKFDPVGSYIRKWVPELNQVPLEFVHEPWTMPLETQEKVGCRIGTDYPGPIVDHAWARERALEAFAVAKDQ